jgi:hypothetical protein
MSKRGQELDAERKWGESPSKASKPDTDEAVAYDFIKAACFVFVVFLVGVIFMAVYKG